MNRTPCGPRLSTSTYRVAVFRSDKLGGVSVSTAAAPSRRNGVDPARLFATLDAGSPAPARADEHHDLAHGGAHAGGAPPWDSRSRGDGHGLWPSAGYRSSGSLISRSKRASRTWELAARGIRRRACRSATAGSRGPASMIATRVPAGSMCAWPGGPLRPLVAHEAGHRLLVPVASSTALELIPCRLVRGHRKLLPAGHLLLDSLSHSLQLQREIQALDLPAGDKAETDPSDPACAPRILATYPSQIRCLGRPSSQEWSPHSGQRPSCLASRRRAYLSSGGFTRCRRSAQYAARAGHPEMPCPSPARAGQCRSRRT